MRIIWLTFATVLLTGCLPSRTIVDENKWGSFTDAKTTYEQVVVGKTTREELNRMGYDPFHSSNVRIENYISINKMFSELGLDFSIPADVETCISKKKRCIAYSVTTGHTYEKRTGNVVLDILRFKRKTHVSGWMFDSIFIMSDDVVVYKLWSGMPNKRKFIYEKNPLGPFQDMSLPPLL